MPFVSKSQQRFMFANEKKLKKQGVDVHEWASKTDFKNLPEKKEALQLVPADFQPLPQLHPGMQLPDVAQAMSGRFGGSVTPPGGKPVVPANRHATAQAITPIAPGQAVPQHFTPFQGR